MLLDLPPEILEHILLRVDASTFSVILMICKTLRSIVLSSSKLIHSQLLRLPGLRVLPKHGPTEREDMLHKFCERAARHASNGVDVFCDSIVYSPCAKDSPYRKVSPFSHLWTSPKLNLLQSTSIGLFTAVVDPDANIHIYKIVEGQVHPRGILYSSLVYMDAGCPSNRGTVRFSIAALSFQKCHCSSSQPPHVVVLYRYHITPAPPGQNSRFVQHAVEMAKRRMKLVVWKACQGDLKILTARDVDIGGVESADTNLKPTSWADQPVSIVTSGYPSRRTQLPPVSIIFQCGSGREVGYHMRTCYYDREIDVNPQAGATKPADSLPNADVSQHLTFTKPIYKIRGRGGKELLFYTEDVVPSHRIVDCTSNTRGVDIVETIPQTVSGDIVNPVFGTYRGIPIAVAHHHHCGRMQDGSKYCINSLLQLVFPQNGTKGAFLLKGVETTDPCRPRNLDNDSPMEHVFVAKFIGLDSPSTSPLKRIVVVSKCKRRIAIADWDIVRLYAIEPDAFLDKKKGSLISGTSSTCVANSYKAFKAEESAPADEAYTSRAAHGYYHSYLRIQGHRKRLVGLDPVQLPSRGVVYTMEFQGDSELWAFTDKGLVKWYWGEGRSANRETRVLGPADLNHLDMSVF
ncbi:F-box domain cyclin-like protein [Venturia nashicola]|nr:F-box domain cyclin-like protein [Venturia nashicola]